MAPDFSSSASHINIAILPDLCLLVAMKKKRAAKRQTGVVGVVVAVASLVDVVDLLYSLHSEKDHQSIPKMSPTFEYGTYCSWTHSRYWSIACVALGIVAGMEQ